MEEEEYYENVDEDDDQDDDHDGDGIDYTEDRDYLS